MASKEDVRDDEPCQRGHTDVASPPSHDQMHHAGPPRHGTQSSFTPSTEDYGSYTIGNDPTVGSPTVTLLQLLLPLNDKVL